MNHPTLRLLCFGLVLLDTAAFVPSNRGHLVLAGRRMSSANDEDLFADFADSLDSRQEESAAVATAAPAATKASTETAKQQTWQEDLEELLDPLTPLGRKQILMSDLIEENGDIRASVQAAIRDRRIDPLLTPTGKKLQDGTRAVARQLTNDILPSIISSSSRQRGTAPIMPPPLFPTPEQVTRTGTRWLKSFQTQVQTGLELLQQDLQDPANRIPQRLSSTQQDLWQKGPANVFSETPTGLPEPKYRVVDTTAAYEIRDYEAYTVASTVLTSTRSSEMIEAWNALVTYLLGANQRGEVMDLTTPITTTSTGEMRVYLTTRDPPEPLDAATNSKNEGDFVYYQQGILMQHIPAARLAVRRFTGFATSGEIARQKEALLTALQLDDKEYELDVPHGQTVGHLVFQYNPPYTIPVLRRNEIAVQIIAGADNEQSLSESWMGEVESTSSL